MRSAAAAFDDLIGLLGSGRALGAAEVEHASAFLLSETGNEALKAGFLRALAAKGETEEEIALFVEAFLARSVPPEIDPLNVPGPLIDVCGTGGDRLDLFNVSTAAMFVLAAGGAAVVKHGNRSVSSQCGGADVLEALGVRIDLPPDALRRRVEETGLGFLFAPLYHPAFKAVGPVRKALAAQGVTTIFNLLGPLLNPARPQYQLVGIFSRPALPKYAAVLRRLGRRRAWAVHGQTADGAGMDELSTLGPTEVHPAGPEAGAPFTLELGELAALGLGPATLGELRGGTREENARLLRGILEGSVRGPKRDLVCLNAAAGFVVAGLAESLAAGLALAREQIASGRALGKLKALAGD